MADGSIMGLIRPPAAVTMLDTDNSLAGLPVPVQLLLAVHANAAYLIFVGQTGAARYAKHDFSSSRLLLLSSSRRVK